MKSQKYCSRKGRIRLSRNKCNLHLLPLSSPSSRLFQVHSPFGPLLLDKSLPSLHINNEFKEQFKAHQIFKTYYGDLNKFHSKDSLLHIESRLDVLVYRTGSPSSLFEARNLIRHHKVFVNDSLLLDPFSHVSPGQSIRIEFPYKYLKKNPSSSNLLVKHLPNNITFALFLLPLHFSHIRFPKGLNVDKLSLSS